MILWIQNAVSKDFSEKSLLWRIRKNVFLLKGKELEKVIEFIEFFNFRVRVVIHLKLFPIP